MQVTFVVQNFENFECKLSELQRKAKRHNLFVPALIAHTQEKIVKWLQYAKVVVIEHTVTVEYENLSVDNGKLIALLNHVENIVNVVPNEVLPKEYLKSSPKCDHCQQNRQRNDTFVIQLPDSSYMQVGRNCLALYLGIDVEHCLRMADFCVEIDSLADEDEPKGYSHYTYDLGFTLALTCHILRTEGYCSRKTAMETGKKATSELVFDAYDDSITGNQKIDVSAYNEEVKDVFSYMLSIENSSNEYELNLYNIANNTYVTRLTMGYAVSAVNAYNRHVAKQAEQQKKSLTDVGQFRKVGDKFTPKNLLTATVIRLSAPIETSYGYNTSVKQWYTMQNDAGYIFTWFTDAYKMETGQVVSLTGCISEYTTYNQVSQTVLKNCRIK